MKTIRFFLPLSFFSMALLNSALAQNADIIFTNGKIFTSDSKQLYVQAIAIKGNKILATGSNAAIKKWASLKTKKIDLRGKTVVPGFNDQQDHAAFWTSPIRLHYETTDNVELNWEGLSKSALLDSIAKLLQKARPGDWIAGMIGNRIIHDTSMRHSLDSIAPNNPVVLQIWWGHGIVANQKCLEAAGLNDGMNDPVGGWYKRNAVGQIASIHENAQTVIWHTIGRVYPDAVKKSMEAYAKEKLKGGITSTLFMATAFSYPTVIQILKTASIPQRLRIVAWPESTSKERQIAEWPIAETQPTTMSSISGIKYLIDHFGSLNYPIDTIRTIINEAFTTKRQLLLHIASNSVFGIVLNLIKETGTAEQWRPLRLRIEHNMFGNPTLEQRKLLRDYGILVMHTPKYNHGSLLRSLLKDGIMVGISPDGTINPFSDIMAITSQQKDPKENITREEAVIAYTKTNAYAEFREKEKGMLTKGMLADLVVLSQDIFTIPADQLPATTSLLTMIDGKIVYEPARER